MISACNRWKMLILYNAEKYFLIAELCFNGVSLVWFERGKGILLLHAFRNVEDGLNVSIRRESAAGDKQHYARLLEDDDDDEVDEFTTRPTNRRRSSEELELGSMGNVDA